MVEEDFVSARGKAILEFFGAHRNLLDITELEIFNWAYNRGYSDCMEGK